MSIGVVGRQLLNRRQGRNRTFNSAGNMFAAISMGLIGYYCTFTDAAPWLVAIQVLDGIAAAVFGVVSVLVIADLTRGSGRLNLVLGAVTTGAGIGAALSQLVAGAVVVRFGYHAGFLFLAAIATAAFLILWNYMPETRGLDSHQGRGAKPRR